jgi:hypothetical protein
MAESGPVYSQIPNSGEETIGLDSDCKLAESNTIKGSYYLTLVSQIGTKNVTVRIPQGFSVLGTQQFKLQVHQAQRDFQPQGGRAIKKGDVKVFAVPA